MNRHWWMIGLVSSMALVVGCGSTPEVSESPTESVPVPVEETVTVPAQQPVATQPPAAPSVPGAVPDLSLPVPAPIEPLPVPALTPPTTVYERLPQVNPGRRDPFATIATTPQSISVAVPAPATSAASLPAPTPFDPNAPLPLIPVNPAAPVPPVGAAPAPLPAPSSPVNELVVSGVVQIGSDLSAIVQAPGESTSRYVRVGDRLANGRIVVRRIEMQGDQDPRVIFVQDGIEIVRTVGSTGTI